MSSASQGSHYERELVNAFDAAGYGALRAPSSGSASDRPLPDLLVGRPRRVETATGELEDVTDLLAIEAKATGSTTAYAEGAEVDALCEAARAWGAKPLLAARFKRRGEARIWYLVHPTDCRRTDGGRFGIPESDAEERACLMVDATDELVVHP